MRIIQRATVVSMLGVCLLACAEESTGLDQIERESVFDHPLSEGQRRGRDVWFENTYGGEKFFAFAFSAS